MLSTLSPVALPSSPSRCRWLGLDRAAAGCYSDLRVMLGSILTMRSMYKGSETSTGATYSPVHSFPERPCPGANPSGDYKRQLRSSAF